MRRRLMTAVMFGPHAANYKLTDNHIHTHTQRMTRCLLFSSPLNPNYFPRLRRIQEIAYIGATLTNNALDVEKLIR